MEGIGEKRAPFRDGHLKLAKEWEKSGNLLLGGAFSNPLDGAVIVFLAENESGRFSTVKFTYFYKNSPNIPQILFTAPWD